MFVDLSESGDPLNDINSLAEVCEPGTIVIAAGQVNDVRLYRDLLSSGIQDYLLKPFTPDQLRDSLSQAQMMLSGPRTVEGGEHAQPHVMSVFVGTRGGVGASTLASSVAWLMSEQAGRLTALLDLDIHFGTGALTLDLEPGTRPDRRDRESEPHRRALHRTRNGQGQPRSSPCYRQKRRLISR